MTDTKALQQYIMDRAMNTVDARDIKDLVSAYTDLVCMEMPDHSLARCTATGASLTEGEVSDQ